MRFGAIQLISSLRKKRFSTLSNAIAQRGDPCVRLESLLDAFQRKNLENCIEKSQVGVI
jgi:hypothetical protein